MPASVTPAGPAAATQPEPKAEPSQERSRPPTREAMADSSSPAGGATGEEIESQNPTDVSEADLAAHLNLSPETRKQVAAHTAGAKASASAGPTADSSGPADSGTGENADGKATIDDESAGEEEENAERGTRNAGRRTEEGDDDEEAEGIPQFIKGIADPKLRKKLEKRFGRLTGKNARLEAALDRQEEELGQYRQQQQQRPNGQQPAPQALGEVRSEQQLDGLVAYHEAVIDLAERNPDGVQIGEGETGKFLPPDEIAALRRTSEKFMRGAERRRRELREHAAARQSYDAQATRDFPEVMKKDTPEFQTAVKLAGRYPWVCQLPEANYALGLMVEGFKALNVRSGKTAGSKSQSALGGPKPKTQNGEQHADDLDERLTPEYQRDHIPPTAPVTPKPPHRSPASAGRFDVKKAAAMTEKFTRPGGATEKNLADALRALDEDEEESPARRRVAV